MTTIHMTIREHWRITQLPRNKWWNDKAQQSTYCCPASTQVGHTQRERERTVTTFEQSRLTMEHPSAEKESNTLKEKRIKSCLSRFDSGAYSRLHFLRAVSQSVGSHTESTAACRQQQQQQRRRRDVGTRTHYYTLTDRPTVCRPIISLVTKNVPFTHSNKSSNVLYWSRAVRSRVLSRPIMPRLHDRANIEQSSNKRQANVQQTSSKYEACIKHSKHRADIEQTSSRHPASIEQTSSWLVQLTYSQLVEPVWSYERGIN